MNVIITGASRGIGYDTALKIASNGNHKVIAIARDEAKLKELVTEASQFSNHSEVIACAMDLMNPDYGKLMEIAGELGEINVLINNAGYLVKKEFAELTDDEWLDIYNVNLFAPVRLIRRLTPFMGKSSQGHIINISSMGGFQGSMKFQGLSAYSTSKAAIISLTECLAQEYKKKNIAVNCLALGGVNTEMFRLAFPGSKALMESGKIAEFIAEFSLYGHDFMNGKVVPLSVAGP